MPCITPESVNESFIANTPLIQETIKNMTLAAPNWYRDVYTVQPWPEGEGTIMQEIVFRGELPETEEGFDSWALIDDPSGCGPICPPNCAYNMSVMGGHAMDTKLTRLMKKDFRTVDYCVDAIQNTRQYQTIFSAIVQNLYNQINFQKEVNVGQNYMTGIAKKAMIDGTGFRFNEADPYTYRPLGDKTLSALTVGALKFLYEAFRRMPGAVPFEWQGGAPLFAMVASPQLISDLYMMDPSLRADYRAAASGSSEYGNKLIQAYNFTDTIRGMFFPVPYLWPRRFRYDSENSRWIRVLPYVKGVPGVVGTFAGMNPNYEDPSYATHEEVLFHGRDPFGVYYQPTVTTIGEGTDFGPGGNPEPGFWDVFYWVNPQTREDPARRVGFFFTTAKIGLQANNSEALIGLLVPRAPVSTMLAYYPAAPCPPAASACDNELPAVGCPVPLVLSLTAHPMTSGNYFVVFSAPIDVAEDEDIQIEMTSGGYVTATVVTASEDQKTFEVSISGSVPECTQFIRVFTDETLGCKAKVLNYQRNASDTTRIDLILDRPIKADTSDTVTLIYGNGTTHSATIQSVDMLTNKYIVDLGSDVFADNVAGVKTVCVPTATDATCPGCDTSFTTEEQCET